MKNIQIAIDGPASAGKSTVAKIIASRLHFIYVDTGAMYRAVTYLGIKNHLDLENAQQLLSALEKEPISFAASSSGQKVFLGSLEVTEEIRSDQVNNFVSPVSALEKIREKLVFLQREIAANQNVVMDGRDIGTQVLPNAQVKIFLIASVKERAQRRYNENIEKGLPADLTEITKSIENRDYLDSHREISPLTKADDAIELDTTGLSIEEVVAEILAIYQKQTAL
ncbi:(d)CMP kinase [Enterococcus timonensis]|uniref:(d)CMP kinase n=1 Tax=Enterococcus timonensis TaxID=1852364 RepID=UPI0008DADD70|nr:(d)CMP kinase [Enterococcus timonensis]